MILAVWKFGDLELAVKLASISTFGKECGYKYLKGKVGGIIKGLYQRYRLML